MTSSSFTKSPSRELRVERRRHTPESPWTYRDLDQRQRQIAAEVRSGGRGVLLLSELAPVITVGKRSPTSDILLTPEGLKSHGIELMSVDRGGLATYHGPGQWVLFWVESLERLTGDRRGVRRAVQMLLDIALETGLNYRKDARCRDGAELGAWSRHGKFAAIGIHIEQGVLLHGLSLNGFKTAQSFQGLRPCGLDLPVDYLLDRSEEFEKLGDQMIEAARSCSSRAILECSQTNS